MPILLRLLREICQHIWEEFTNQLYIVQMKDVDNATIFKTFTMVSDMIKIIFMKTHV